MPRIIVFNYLIHALCSVEMQLNRDRVIAPVFLVKYFLPPPAIFSMLRIVNPKQNNVCVNVHKQLERRFVGRKIINKVPLCKRQNIHKQLDDSRLLNFRVADVTANLRFSTILTVLIQFLLNFLNYLHTCTVPRKYSSAYN